MTTNAKRREPWPVALAALLLAMIGTSTGFYEVAARHPDPLVVQDAFAAERSVSERLRAERRAEALGWDLALAVELRPGIAHVEARLRDRGGALLAADRVSLLRERPAEGGLDATVPLTADGDGWTGDVALPRPGRWHLVVRAERGADTAERTYAVWAP
jgi:nitrogen fixation protein FixH